MPEVRDGIAVSIELRHPVSPHEPGVVPSRAEVGSTVQIIAAALTALLHL